MTGWTQLLELVTVLAAAFLVGTLFEKLRIGAVVGYLFAGVLVGPGTFGWISETDTVNGLAELGIALVLFTTGLEFSILRLKKLGRGTLFAGIAQLVLCILLFTGIGLAFQLSLRPALALACIVSVSSTAIVLRVLRDRGELDAPHGKVSFGILIMQDIALVPLVVLVTLLGQGKEPTFTLSRVLPSLLTFLGASLVFIFLVTRLLPRAFRSRAMATNRELPILLALVTCTGAAWAAHSVGLSASLGAFLAGVLLAETPFEEQIRSDMSSFKAVFGTIFFVSVGMLADARWIAGNFPLVLMVLGIIVFGKVLFNFVAIRAFKRVTITSVAAAITLAQVGELGFILLQLASAGNLLTGTLFNAVSAAAVLSMALSPLMIARAPSISRALVRRLLPAEQLNEEEQIEERSSLTGHFIIVGFGTAGRTATRILGEAQYPVVTIDVDPKYADNARELGAIPKVGDATQIELLEDLRLNDARSLIVAIPEPRTASLVIANARRLAPNLTIVARSRYHAFRSELIEAGATLVIGEEELLGRRLGEEASRLAIGVVDEDVVRAD